MEELEAKVAELEEKLTKARTTYKEQKAELDALKARNKELEDEITINGNASEEVAKLNERLEKAKSIFAEQKDKIKALTEDCSTLQNDKDNLIEANKKLTTDFEAVSNRLLQIKEMVAKV